MRARQRSQAIQFADRILGILNRVELMRKSACWDFYPYGKKAASLWRTAKGMEEVLIRENGLPDLDAILVEIEGVAETGFGVKGGTEFHSYMKSAIALWEIDLIVRRAITPQLRILLEIIAADGFDVDYCPVPQMVKSKTPAAKDGQEGGGE
jgi:hypothetical protein